MCDGALPQRCLNPQCLVQKDEYMQELNHNPKGDSETEPSYLNAASESCQLAKPPTPLKSSPRTLLLQVLFDLGVVSSKEPFQRLVSQGMILGEVEYTVARDEDGRVVEEDHPGAVVTRVSMGGEG